MIPHLVTPRQLEIASIYWGRPWWDLSVEMIQEALDWWYSR